MRLKLVPSLVVFIVAVPALGAAQRSTDRVPSISIRTVHNIDIFGQPHPRVPNNVEVTGNLSELPVGSRPGLTVQCDFEEAARLVEAAPHVTVDGEWRLPQTPLLK